MATPVVAEPHTQPPGAMRGSTDWKVTGSGVHLYGQAGGALRGLRVVAKDLFEQRLRLKILTLGRHFATVNLEFKLRSHDLVSGGVLRRRVRS